MSLNIEQIQDEYTSRCKACLTPKFKLEYYVLTEAARNYGLAIKDILGGQMWLTIIEEAARQMPADIPNVGGIPLMYPEPLMELA